MTEHEYLVPTEDEFDAKGAAENVARYLEREFMLKRVNDRKDLDDDSFIVTTAAGVAVMVSLGNRAMVCKGVATFRALYDARYGLHGSDVLDYNVWQVRPSANRRRTQTGPGFGKGVWRLNEERHQIDVSLAKEDVERRAKLKEMGFRWWREGGFWYNRDAPAIRDFVKSLGLDEKRAAS